MEGCLFCGIIAGKVSSFKVYEDGKYVAFLDIGPSSIGHTVVIPKTHYALLTDMPLNESAEFFAMAAAIAPKIQAALDAQGFNIGANVDKAAGQAVPHVHIHIIPRYEDDGGGAIQSIVRMPPPERKEELQAQLNELSVKIREELKGLDLGAPSAPTEKKPEAKKKEKKWKFFEE